MISPCGCYVMVFRHNATLMFRYANRAKNIKNKPHINEDPKDALLREYQEEIKKLRGLLAGQLGPDGIKGKLMMSHRKTVLLYVDHCSCTRKNLHHILLMFTSF